ncbi:TPA: FAD-binding domain-containing protein [Pseudomonas aeruginosa]
MFNPVTQGEKFDPKGIYVRRFIPELAGLDDKFIHRPWEAPAGELNKAGIVLGQDYPKPIIALDFGRQRALDAFAALRSE